MNQDLGGLEDHQSSQLSRFEIERGVILTIERQK